jgi:hypothetical protein
MSISPITLKNLVTFETLYVCSQTILFDEANGYQSSVDTTHTVTEALLSLLKSKVEDVINEPLIPTYSFANVYRNGENVHKSTGKLSCEITLSLQLQTYNVLNTDGWSIILDGLTYHMNDGDGILYEGAKCSHERQQLHSGSNGFHIQTYLHYVRANGRFAEFAFNLRNSIGSI